MSDRIVVNGDTFETFIDESRIQRRVAELGAQINKDYAGKTPTFIGILNGSFVFFADLIRHITLDCEVDFLKLSSYGDEKISSGQVRMLKELNCEVTGRDIIVVEDIVDSGLSVDFMRSLIAKEKPASLKFVSLLIKKGVPKIDFPINYIGFEIPPDFVIGYGLDYAQKVRNLRSIYKLVSPGNGAKQAS